MKAPDLIHILSDNYGDGDEVTLSSLEAVLEDVLPSDEFDDFFDCNIEKMPAPGEKWRALDK